MTLKEDKEEAIKWERTGRGQVQYKNYDGKGTGKTMERGHRR